jgi:small-conductance mechanosensitive channel
MLQSRLSMFCPRCQAEYLSHVHRCSDCDVPLVERLSATHGVSDRTRVSGFVLFKELGVFIVIPVTVLATMLVFVTLRDNPFEIQIATVIMYTGLVFFFVFCDAGAGRAIKAKGTKGFSLGEKAVRQKLPLIVCIHAGFLVVLLAGVTGAIWLRSHTWVLWHLDTDYFDLILLVTGVAIAFAQIHFFRRLLGRALDEQRSGQA